MDRRELHSVADDKMNNVCQCKSISREKMIEAIEDGANTVNMVKYKTGAGNGACHGRRCTPKIESLLEELKN